MDNKNIIYALCEPNTEDVRYVGLSSTGFTRPKSHFTDYRLYRKDRKSNRFTHCQVWIQKVKREGNLPNIIILEVCEKQSQLNDRERFWIKYYRELIGDRLTNHQDGGYNSRVSGWKHSEETIKKLKEAAKLRHKKNPELIKNMVEKAVNSPNRNKRFEDPEYINKIRNNLLNSFDYKERLNKLIENGRKYNKSISKKIIDQNGKIYESISKAAIELKTSGSHIRRQLTGKYSHCKGYTFTYLENK